MMETGHVVMDLSYGFLGYKNNHNWDIICVIEI